MLTVHCRSRQLLHTVGSRCDQRVRLTAAGSSPFSRPGARGPAGARACQPLLCNANNSSRKDTAANGNSSSSSSRMRSGRGSTAASAAATSTVQQQEQQAPVVTHLEELSLSGYALVPSAVVALRPGLNVLSGQSGAGKSVLLGALDLLAGGAAPPDCVRPPADTALLQATWRLAPAEAEAAGQLLAEMGLPAKAAPQPADAAGAAAAGAAAAAGSAAVLHIRREISTASAAAGGGTRSRVLINGVPSSLRVLRALAGLLLDLNGQGASAALRDGQQQLQLLDKIAGTTAAAARLSELVSRLAWLEGRLAQLDDLADEGQRTALQRRVDLIRRAGLRPGEEERLRQRLAALESRRSCLEAAAAVAAGIRGDSGGAAGSGGGLTEGLRLVMSQLRGVLAAEETQQRLAAAAAAAAARQGSREGSGAAAEEGDEEEDGVGDDGDEEDDEAEDDDVSAGSSSAGVSALRAALEELELVEEGLGEAAGQLSLYADSSRYSASEAAEASARLDLIETLSRRFRVRGAGACQQLLGLAASWSDQLEAYHEAAGQAEVWAAEAEQLQQQVTQLAVAMSRQRRAAAAGLAAAVQGQLAQLAMADARFAVDLTWQPVQDTAQLQAGPCSRAVLAPTAADPRCSSSASPAAAGDAAAAVAASGSDGAGAVVLCRLAPASGLDSVQFLMSAGPSEPLRPLAATASGGEAARIMLALKAAPSAAAAAAGAIAAQSEAAAAAAAAGAESPAAAAAAAVVGAPVLVLDEPDAGVGSRLGEPLARLLRRLVAASGSSSSGAAVRPAASQVLVVTHTPQIAAAAGHHIQVVKVAGPDGRVVTSFRHLASQQERVAELADMLGLGEDEGANLAAELLAAAAAAAAAEQGQEWRGSSDDYAAANSSRSSSSQVEAAAAEESTGRREEPAWAESSAAESAAAASSSDSSSPVVAGRLLLGLSVAAATAGAASSSAAAAADVGGAPSPAGQQQLQPAQHWHI